MNEIIDFLQDYSDKEDFPDNFFDNKKLPEYSDKLKNLLEQSEKIEGNIFDLKVMPKIKTGQIWQCKKQYKISRP